MSRSRQHCTLQENPSSSESLYIQTDAGAAAAVQVAVAPVVRAELLARRAVTLLALPEPALQRGATPRPPVLHALAEAAEAEACSKCR
jgi:hypothetical protein